VSYSLEADPVGGGASPSRAQQNLTVVAPEQPLPQPTEDPNVPEFPDPPTIDGFSVSPSEITLGECVTINWSTGGGTSYVRIMRNGAIILDDAGFSGQETDCPTAGEYYYQLEAHNPYEVVDVRDATVLVWDSSPEMVIDPTEEPVETEDLTITETPPEPPAEPTEEPGETGTITDTQSTGDD
jgi:hypothetical protein